MSVCVWRNDWIKNLHIGPVQVLNLRKSLNGLGCHGSRPVPSEVVVIARVVCLMTQAVL